MGFLESTIGDVRTDVDLRLWLRKNGVGSESSPKINIALRISKASRTRFYQTKMLARVVG
jgi:hypothetical protein